MDSKLDIFILTLGAIGAIWLTIKSLSLLNFLYIYLRPSSLQKYHYNHSNSSAPPWAIVTGATDGIGKEYAHELALHDFNIVLHGRNSLKLHHARHDLQTEFPHLQFRILQLDASFSSPESNQRLKEEVEKLKDLHITVLINNVGTAMKANGKEFEEILCNNMEDIDSLLNVNARFLAQFTRAVLPLLISHDGPALIMTMGSVAKYGMPNIIMYGASKAFDLSFSKALRQEMRASFPNVEVLGIQTGEVTGTEHDRSASSFFRPDSRQFARAALSRVGCGEEVVPGWWTHVFMVWAMDIMPIAFKDRLLKVAMEAEKEKKAKAEKEAKEAKKEAKKD